jgi:uncharacterized protein YukE
MGAANGALSARWQGAGAECFAQTSACVTAYYQQLIDYLEGRGISLEGALSAYQEADKAAAGSLGCIASH